MNKQKYKNSCLVSKIAEELPISGQTLSEIMKLVFAKGATIRFKARGVSMSPFIRDGDVITVAPTPKGHLGIGKIVAFTHPTSLKLAVHRIIKRHKNCLFIQGDNKADCPDGYIPYENLLGEVIRIERNGHQVWLGLGPERVLIAWFSRIGLIISVQILLAEWRKRFTQQGI